MRITDEDKKYIAEYLARGDFELYGEVCEEVDTEHDCRIGDREFYLYDLLVELGERLIIEGY